MNKRAHTLSIPSWEIASTATRNTAESITQINAATIEVCIIASLMAGTEIVNSIMTLGFYFLNLNYKLETIILKLF